MSQSIDSRSPQERLLINFPALSFSQGWVSVATSSDDITHATSLGLKTQGFKDLVIVDSSGNKYQVVDVHKIRTLRMRATIGDFLEVLSGNRRWQIELQFSPDSPTKITMDEVKALVIDCFNRNPDYWEEMTHFEEFREKIVASDSLDHVFSIFKEFHLF